MSPTIIAILVINAGLFSVSNGSDNPTEGQDYTGIGNSTLMWGFTWHFSWNWVSDAAPATTTERVNSRFQDFWVFYGITCSTTRMTTAAGWTPTNGSEISV